MKKLIKNITCPKCGATYKGFYINPICTCGHQIREFSRMEKYTCENFDEDESVYEKRTELRNSVWNVADSFSYFGIAFSSLVWMLLADFVLWTQRDAPSWDKADFTVALFIAAIFTTIFALFSVGVVCLSWYFKRLKCMDDKYFNCCHSVKKKIVKEIVCPECGKVHKGIYINPICTCGHKLRELTEIEEENYDSSASPHENRRNLRETARNSVLDVFYSVDFGVPFVSIVMCLVFFISFFIFSSLTPNSRKKCMGVCVLFFSFGLYFLCFEVTRMYFKRLDRKDDEYFAAQGEQ